MNAVEHEKFTRQIQTLAETLQGYIEPERGVKRIRITEGSQDNSSAVKAIIPFQNCAEAEVGFPLKTILHGLAGQVVQLIIRDITRHRRLCKQKRS